MAYWHNWEYKGWRFDHELGEPESEQAQAIWISQRPPRRMAFSLRLLVGARTLQQRRQLMLMLQQQIDVEEERMRLFGGAQG